MNLISLIGLVHPPFMEWYKQEVWRKKLKQYGEYFQIQNNRKGLGMGFRILPWKSNNSCKISEPQTLTEREKGGLDVHFLTQNLQRKSFRVQPGLPEAPLSPCLPEPCVCPVLSLGQPWGTSCAVGDGSASLKTEFPEGIGSANTWYWCSSTSE